MTMMSRRLLLGAAAALAAPMRAGQAAALNLDTPQGLLEAFAAMRGARDDRTVFWWLNDVRHAVVDTTVTPLFRARVGTFIKTRKNADGSYTLTILETSYYTDLVTNEILRRFKNPLTGKMNEIRHNVLGPNAITLTTTGIVPPANPVGGRYDLKSERGPATIIGDDVFIPEDVYGRIIFDEPGRKSYETTEMNTYRALASHLADASRAFVPSWVSYQSVTGWRPWMEMGDRPGHLSARAFGAKVERLADMPRDWLALARQENPDIIADIDAAFTKPSAKIDR